MNQLAYAAIKAVQLPKQWDLPGGRHKVDVTLHLQGEVVVGQPTFYTEPVKHKVDTLVALCGLLRVSKKRATTLYHTLQSLSDEDQEAYDVLYGALLREQEKESRNSRPRKERKGSITGNIKVTERK